DRARLTLDRLEDDGCRVVRDRGAESRDVVEGDVGDVRDEGGERLAVGRLVGQRQSTGGPSVEGPFSRHDAGSSGATRQLDGRLDRLRPRVGEEDAGTA